jgi:hypothetical protein
MCRFFAMRILLLAVGFVPVVAAPAEAQYYTGECRVWFQNQNRNRHVWGDVTAECTYACPPFIHSHLWGNWGVESSWGHRHDSLQFPGWKNTSNTSPCGENFGSKPEWNSCTNDSSRPRGDSYWFNYNNSTEQLSEPVAAHVSSIYTFQNGCPADWDGDGWLDTGGCWAGEGGITMNDFIETWEIDPNDADERIMRIDYPSLSAWYHCEQDGVTCWPTDPSPWTPSNGGSYMDAEMRVIITLVQYEDFGCCASGTWICF